MAEDLTGIVLAAAAAGALLVGHAVVIDRHEKLGLPLQTDDGELAQSDVDPLAVVAEAQVTAEAGADAGGNFGQLAVAGAALAHVHQLHVEDDGIDRLYHSGGQIALADVLLVQPVKDGLGAENFGVALTAEEDDPLVKDGQAADFHRPGGAYKGVGGDTVEIADVHGIETAVEADGLHVDVHIQQFCGTGLDADGAVNGALGALGGIETKILNAVLVTATIKDFFRVYAHGLPDTGGILHGTGHDLIRHCNTS